MKYLKNNCHSEGEARRIPCVQKPTLQRGVFFEEVLLSGDSSLRCAPFRMTVVLLCIGVMLLLCSAPLFLVAQSVNVTATIDTNTILIGDQVHLTLKAEHQTGKILNWPLIGDTITKQIEVVGRSGIDTSFPANSGNTILSQTFTITSFDSGYFLIPSFRFSIVGDTSNYVETDPLPLTVQTVEVDTTQAIKDIKAPMNTPFSLAEVWLLIKENKWWIITGVVLLIGIILLVIYLKRPKEIISVKKPKIPPHITALKNLKELEYNKLWQQNKVKLYYSNLTEIIRIYIENRFNIIAMELTTDEILTSFKPAYRTGRHVDIKAETKGKLKQLLSLADMVKFAKAKPIVSEHELSLNNAYDFVRETIPVEKSDAQEQRI